MAKISEIFYIIQGHQITDEEIYTSIGEYPIYTGNNDIKGYWDKTIVNEKMLPCLSYPTKAFAGNISIHTNLFDANNTAILYLKEKYKDEVELEWFKYILPAFFLDKMTSKEGVSYLNKDIVQDIDIKIPSKEIQKAQIDLLKIIEKKEEVVRKDISILEKLLNKHILFKEDLENEKILISEILSYISRNDSLSEEGIYKMYPRSKGSTKVLSGSTEDVEYGEIDSNLDDIHYLKDRQCLHIVTRGKAGKLTFINKGNYATNTNAFLLYIKKDKWSKLNIKNEYEEEIFLKFLKIYLQPIFYSVSSNSDVSVFPLTDIMKKLYIPKFKYNEEYIKITKLIDEVENKEKKLNAILREIENVKMKMLTY